MWLKWLCIVIENKIYIMLAADAMKMIKLKKIVHLKIALYLLHIYQKISKIKMYRQSRISWYGYVNE